MGYRSHFALISAGRPSLFSSHRDGLALPRWTLAGPEALRRHVEGLLPCESLHYGDAIDGGAVLELDRKVLSLWFDADWVRWPGVLRHYLRLCEIAWGRWQVRWVPGIEGIAEASGQRLPDAEPDEGWGWAASLEPGGGGPTWITVTDDRGPHDVPFAGHVGSVLNGGPALLEACASARTDGRSPNEAEIGGPVGERPDPGGAIVDIRRRALVVWCTALGSRSRRKLLALDRVWPGWRLQLVDGVAGLPLHALYTGRDPDGVAATAADAAPVLERALFLSPQRTESLPIEARARALEGRIEETLARALPRGLRDSGLSERPLPGALGLLDLRSAPPGARLLLCSLLDPRTEGAVAQEAGRPTRLDGLGWPVRFDLALALWALERAGPELEPALLELAFDVASGAALTEQAKAALKERMAPDRAEILAGLVFAADEGWLAYHAHRRLPSIAAELAAGLIRSAVARSGDERLLSELLGYAAELLIGRPPPVGPLRAGPSLRVRIASQRSTPELPRRLTAALVERGHQVELVWFPRFPAGDSCVPVADRIVASGSPDRVVLALTEGMGSAFVAREVVRRLEQTPLVALALEAGADTVLGPDHGIRAVDATAHPDDAVAGAIRALEGSPDPGADPPSHPSRTGP